MKTIFITIFLAVVLLIQNSCEDFVKVDPPQMDLTKTTVFETNETALSAISGIYHQMIASGFASGNTLSMAFVGALSADEIVNLNTTGFAFSLQQFNDNSLIPSNTIIERIWSEPYQYIYKANSVIEGLKSSTGVSSDLKRQLEGEAKFIRAFSHFYLANLFGDIPLVLTTDYSANSSVSRTSMQTVYDQIVSDLLDAQSLMLDNYSHTNSERVRPNKYVATALLARVYLYMNKWTEAEEQSTLVINSNLYTLPNDLNNVFLKNSEEAIWQLSSDFGNTNDIGAFSTTNCALRPELMSAFEPNDNRKSNWIGSSVVGSQTFYSPRKYKATFNSAIAEYSMIIRLAEIYLIRSEAKAQTNKIAEAINDLDSIRKRAGLSLLQITNPTITKEELLVAIEHERRLELFSEWGHRWLDLKRTNRIDQVLGQLKNTWEPTDQLYPIPAIQIQNDPSMSNAQNPGY